MSEDEPFIIESPTKIRLGPIAKEQAREYGWTDVQMAKYLLNLHKQRMQNFAGGNEW